jgi:transcription termination factor Rho
MKTRDIKTADSAQETEETQAAKKETSSQPTRTRTPRVAKSSSPKTASSDNRPSSEATPEDRSAEIAAHKAFEESQRAAAAEAARATMPEQYADRDREIGAQERRNMQHSQYQQPREEYNRPAQQQYNNNNQHTPYERPGFVRRPLEDLSLAELIQYARRYGIMGAAITKKDELLKKVRYAEEHPNAEMAVEGVLEKLPDGFGFLRSALYDYVSGADDIYVSPSQIRRFGLRTGDTIKGEIRKPKEGEKYFALLKVSQVNYAEPLSMIDRPHFDSLSPQHPITKFNLEFDPMALSTRILDLFTPIGKGQRGLIVAPPKVGKTLLLKETARAIITNHPEVHLIVLCVDERPEEVADMRRALKGTTAEVISSTFDESAERHVAVAEIVLEKAKRLVECNRDVVVLLDSITRLARAYNTIAPASGKVLTGGIDAHALQRPKRFFGAARATEEAGSLTILATALVETGSRMDEVIFEEFKGTGNMEMNMTRKLSHRRIFPAFDLLISGTRRDDLLLSEEELNKVWILQKLLSTMNTVEGMEFLIDKMKKTKTNAEFFDSINKRTAEV